MVVRIARCLGASSAFVTALAAAQSATPPLPPQNYGAQPGFFRSAPEMAALSGSSPGVMAPATMHAPAQPSTASPIGTPIVVPQASTVVVAPERVPDPTQNLQWTERQMDRAETTAVQQRQQALATPQPIAPGAYNGETDPATR